MTLPSFIVLLRIPFSYYLLPVFLFAFALSGEPDLYRCLDLFIILHLFVYPASNGFNSYMDKDEDSIGGLKNPPKPNIWLLLVSMLMNVVGIYYSYCLDPILAILIAIYVIISIAYSMHGIRLKKYAIISFISVSFFQGFWIYAIVFLFGQKVDYLQAMGQTNFLVPAIISSLMVAGAYPMTQIYQHKADEKSGDKTLSRLLGLKGTFKFCGAINLIIGLWLGHFFITSNQSHYFYSFLLFVFPSIAFFIWWALKVWGDTTQANFSNTMLLNTISATCMILFFTFIYFIKIYNGISV
jgi:4-hydroxybenzoate polyprenyltransferase